ncbi:hypothetical protein [Streptomyces sp. NPDC048196]|uniref:hypothetical protein n=1 Tax=Streptomyces sp. NPDC048196 TaxID=3154712 RepID=UPI0033C35CBA
MAHSRHPQTAELQKIWIGPQHRYSISSWEWFRPVNGPLPVIFRLSLGQQAWHAPADHAPTRAEQRGHYDRRDGLVVAVVGDEAVLDGTHGDADMLKGPSACTSRPTPGISITLVCGAVVW